MGAAFTTVPNKARPQRTGNLGWGEALRKRSVAWTASPEGGQLYNLQKLLTASAVLVGVVAFGHLSAFAQLSTVLLGGDEVSDAGAANAGDPNGSGTATVLIRETDATLCYAILVTGIDTPTLAHIHEGVAGTNRP